MALTQVSRTLNDEMDHHSSNTTMVGWVGDPGGRGTLGILLSCLATLTICVWTALHLNIPGPTDSNARGWARRALWMTLGVFCSELVLLTAWRQWAAAESLTEQMAELERQQDKTADKPRWTITHGYYAIMGGFVFQLTEEQQSQLGLAQRYFTVTPAGVLLLAKCGLLTDIQRAEIKDKSKQDSLTKAIVLLQTLWFLVQCIVRKAQNLPLTLLEYHTIAHIVCACIIFGLWWHKLRDAQHPTLLTGDWVLGICAYMYMSSRMSGKATPGFFADRTGLQPEILQYRWNVEEQHLVSCTVDLESIHTKERYIFSWLSKSLDSRIASERTTDRLIESGEHQADKAAILIAEARANAASGAISSHAVLHKRSSHWPGATSLLDNMLVPAGEQLVVPFMSDWPDDSLEGQPQGQIMGSIMWLASSLNGAIHVCAWNSAFPSHAERFLWRFCSGYITASGLFWLVGNLAALTSKTLARWYHQLEKMELPPWQTALIVAGEIVCGATYIFARTYLVVASVISLRKMPWAAYETASWPETLPHL